MKIHIDTSTAEEQAKAQAKKQASGTKSKSTSGKKSGSGSSAPTGTPAPAKPKVVKPKPIPKAPPKETKAPTDVAQARKRQSSVLKERQKREVSGKIKGPSRDMDAGTGFGFQTYPFL